MAEKILFFFSALGVFNVLLVALYLFVIKPNRQLEDSFLGILLLCLAIRVGVSCFHFFGDIPKALIKWGLMANLLLGPAILFLMKALANRSQKIARESLLHFGVLSFCSILCWALFDFTIWNWRIRYIIHAILTVYLLQVAFVWRREIWAFFSSKKLASSVKKAVIIYLSLVLICLGFAVSLFTSYILGPLTFSLVFYLAAGYFLLSNQKEKKHTVGRKIDQQAFNRINQKLTQLMEVDNVYRNPDIKLASLANQLSVSKQLLSSILNDNLETNFHQYINHYRIHEACRLLKENKHYSIEAIGQEVGFHSRSSFFAAFKKLKGTTPSKYREG